MKPLFTLILCVLFGIQALFSQVNTGIDLLFSSPLGQKQGFGFENANYLSKPFFNAQKGETVIISFDNINLELLESVAESNQTVTFNFVVKNEFDSIIFKSEILFNRRANIFVNDENPEFTFIVHASQEYQIEFYPKEIKMPYTCTFLGFKVFTGYDNDYKLGKVFPNTSLFAYSWPIFTKSNSISFYTVLNLNNNQNLIEQHQIKKTTYEPITIFAFEAELTDVNTTTLPAYAKPQLKIYFNNPHINNAAINQIDVNVRQFGYQTSVNNLLGNCVFYANSKVTGQLNLQVFGATNLQKIDTSLLLFPNQNVPLVLHYDQLQQIGIKKPANIKLKYQFNANPIGLVVNAIGNISIEKSKTPNQITDLISDGQTTNFILFFSQITHNEVNTVFNFIGDVDLDKLPNSIDADADNDGFLNEKECFLVNPYADLNQNNIPDFADPQFIHPLLGRFQDLNNDGLNDLFDLDLDGIPNFLDHDANNDAVYDIIGAGFTDNDFDGMIDNFIDANADGLDDNTHYTEVTLFDFDLDAYPDFLDVDADEDGLSNLLEAQGLANFNPLLNRDLDFDGIDDNFDKTFGNKPASIVDANQNGFPDYLDAEEDGIKYGGGVCEAEKFYTEKKVLCSTNLKDNLCVTQSLPEAISQKYTSKNFVWNLGNNKTTKGKTVNICYQNHGNYLIAVDVFETNGTLIKQNVFRKEISTAPPLQLSLNIPENIEVRELFEFSFNLNLPIFCSINKVYWDLGNQNYSCEYKGASTFFEIGKHQINCFVEVKAGTQTYNLCATAWVQVSE